jgi:hypothetical protein
VIFSALLLVFCKKKLFLKIYQRRKEAKKTIKDELDQVLVRIFQIILYFLCLTHRMLAVPTLLAALFFHLRESNLEVATLGNARLVTTCFAAIA